MKTRYPMNSRATCQILDNDSMPLQRDQITNFAASQLLVKGERELCSSPRKERERELYTSKAHTLKSQVAQLDSLRHIPKGKGHVASLNPPNHRIKFSRLASLPRAMLGVKPTSKLIGTQSATTN